MEWIRRHKLILSTIVIVLLFFGILGVILVDMFDEDPASSTNTGQIDGGENKEITQSIDTTKKADVIENPFEEDKKVIVELDILNYMHGMSHQKVIADKKWIHYKISQERIEFLLDVIEEGNFKNKDTYNSILNKWLANDFSHADEDHNVIWKLQGGTVGKATGVMTKEQEEEYIQRYDSQIK
ncbi:DUF6241 domain-containing protein [Bacillus weihaiensis]|uniref:PRK06770 family protein n=1 Tax=Bacillus weihaiensis TaxID=1547283 RepID=A0A1L3MNC0_9BACI|nr:DUF6241 domain-containing protein [Bacillus weihaiensis]APH03835.1 hypothetical protein A9C19_03145 [Bacillus weihaiensis]